VGFVNRRVDVIFGRLSRDRCEYCGFGCVVGFVNRRVDVIFGGLSTKSVQWTFGACLMPT